MSTHTGSLVHKISIDFLGVDLEDPAESRNRYGVQCSCGADRKESVSHSSADRWVTEHAAQVKAAGEKLHRY